MTKQLNAINVRMEKLTNKMNKEYNACMQELLALSTVLQNVEHGHPARSHPAMLLK